MTTVQESDARPVSSRRWLLVVGFVAVVVAATLIAVLRVIDGGNGHVRGGLVEVTFTTADGSEQAAVGRDCGMDRRGRLTSTTVRYSFAPERRSTVFACLDRSRVVRTVGILG